jgi:hypothetical protein
MRSCVVVALSEATREFLAGALNSAGMNATLLTSLAELTASLEAVPTCGILLDLTATIAASTQDKRAAQEFLELYPSAKFRFANQQVLIVGETLEAFVARCQQFEPRVTHKYAQVDMYLAVYLSENESFTGAEKSVTVNVADTGYFVYSAREWTVGDAVWIRFHDKEAAICGSVRSVRPWGNNETFPGIGIEVEEQDTGRT